MKVNTLLIESIDSKDLLALDLSIIGSNNSDVLEVLDISDVEMTGVSACSAT